MNLQVISAPDGEILWVSGPLPGATHDLTAARIWGITHELPPAAWSCWPTRATSAQVSTCTLPTGGDTSPARRRPPTARPAPIPRRTGQRPAETWHILRKLRCCPWKGGQLAKAIHVLQTREIPE